MSRLLLLDTHAWIWFGQGDHNRMKPAMAKVIQEAAWQGELCVSAISIWEIGMLDAYGRISLGQAVEEWIDRALALPGLRLVGLDPAIALAASRLPGNCHQDPSDRILIASARHLDAGLVTADRRIHEYASGGYLRVIRL